MPDFSTFKWLGFSGQGQVKYRFINEHRHEYRVATMYLVLKVERAGFYAWLHQPNSNRAIQDDRLLGLIRDSYVASGGVYDSRRPNGRLWPEVRKTAT